MAENNNEVIRTIQDRGSDEIRFLMLRKGLTVFEIDGSKFFSIITKKGRRIYPGYTKLHFFHIHRNEYGIIKHLKFEIDVSTCWKEADGFDTPEIQYMREKYMFLTDSNDYFQPQYYIRVDGEWYSYPKGTVFKFSNVRYREDGTVQYLYFTVVVKESIRCFPDEDTPETRYMNKKYGLMVDYRSEKNRYILTKKDKKYPEGSTIVFSDREYGKFGNLIELKYSFEMPK